MAQIEIERELTVCAKPYTEKFLPLHREIGKGEIGDAVFALKTTIGMGGVSVLLAVTRNGRTVTEEVNLSPLFEQWVRQVEDEMEAQEGATDQQDAT